MTEWMDEFQRINNAVNQIPYVAGLGPTEPVDWWTYVPAPGQSWVCRDYVEDKAQQLRSMGFPYEDMRVVLCWTEHVVPPTDDSPTSGREYHAILACDLDNRTYFLDSRTNEIYTYDSAPMDYLWDRIQMRSGNDFEPMTQDTVLV